MTNATFEQELDTFELFSRSSPITTKLLKQSVKLCNFKAGDVLIEPGAEEPGLMVFLSGKVKATNTNSAGKEQIFTVFKSGQVFGLCGLVGYPSISFGLQAISPGEYVIIPFDVATDAFRKDPDFATYLMRCCVEFARSMLDKVDAFSLKDAQERLAGWLLDWIECNHADQPEPIQVVLPYTQSEIAAQIGTVREVISRGFSRMEQDGILSASGKRLRIYSRDGLSRAAGVASKS